MSLIGHVYLHRSSKEGKKPKASELNYGELAINYNADHEFLSVKNSSGDIITFSSDNSQEGLWKKGTGESAVKLDSGATASGKLSVAEGSGTNASGDYSHAEGLSTNASDSYSHAEGYSTTASGDCSHAEGSYTTAKGYCSHAEGYSTTASGAYSHSEGAYTTASDYGSHAEGTDTTASGAYSHSEGAYTTASGNQSHAEGNSTTASGNYSHAEGLGTITTNIAEHASGKYNQSNPNQIYSIGVGTDNEHRRNAIMVMQNGDTSISGGTLNVSGDTHFHGPYNYLSGTTIIENLSATPTTFDDALSETSINAVQNSAITKVIFENEKVTAASLNDLNDRKLDYSGITTDSAMTYTASSTSGVKLSHTKRTVLNDNVNLQSTDTESNGNLKVIKTDDFGHVIDSRDATAADIEKLGVASKGLKITYGSVQTLPTGYTYGTARTYDGKTVMNLSVPQKITDLEGGNDLSYVHLSGDTMYGKLCLKATSASTANTITLNNADGTITATTMFSTSDKRLKENIKEISDDEIEKVKNVDLKSFKYINDRKQHFGVIAQELEESGLGELVSFDSNGYKTVDYISLLILKIAELEKEIKKLKNKL